ncbi:MAG: diguanylate cyclase [Erythrobacter sp.]
MSQGIASKGETIFRPAVYGLAWLVCAMVALDLTQGEDGIAAVWPSSGIFVAALLHMERQGRIATTGFVAIASMLANFLGGVSLLDCIGYTIANLAEGWLVFFLMGGDKSRGELLAKPINLIRFAASAVAVSALSSLVAGLLSANLDPRFLTSWASTVGLGMLIVAPFILFIVQHDRGYNRLSTLRAVWVLVLVAVLSLVAFGQNQIPLLFLPVIAISIATAVLGISGTSLALLVVTVIGSVMTIFNKGPVSGFFPAQEHQVLYMQVYILGLLISALPLGLLLAQRQRDLFDLETSNRFLTAAEKAARVGHWRYSPAEGQVYLSSEARRLFGSEAAPRSIADIAALFHEDDRARVAGTLHQSLQTGVPFVFEARLPGVQGQVFDTECRGELGTESRPDEYAIFGTIMDITDRAATIRELATARTRAENEAREIKHLAETDHLTGIANRRKILAHLAATIRDTEKRGESVSVAMIDVDHFKSINDNFGHEAGDRVLKRIGALLDERFKEIGAVGRFGGEEFIVVTRGLPASELEAQCTAFADVVAADNWLEEGPERVTVSIGIAEQGAGASENALLKAADKALYFAKRGGRNRTIVFDKSLIGA